jgi:hypothetical protein
VTFFSTFEVKVELENSTTKQNSNYQLVINLFDAIKPEPVITNIADVHAAPEGQRFTVEGTVTSNASGYDASTAFFDCIYVQDATGGINLFPVAGDFRIGQKVRVTGVTSSYQGERQLAVNSIKIIDAGIDPVLPEKVRTGAAMDPSNTGRLILVEGKIKSLGYASDGTLETIEVNDGSGVARVFIDGYIMSDYRGLDGLQVNDRIIAIGLGSVDTLGARIRVRNRSEIFEAKSGNIYHAVQVKSNPGGSVSPSGILYVPEGGTGKFKLTPDEGYKVQKVLVNGLPAEVVNNAFTVVNIKGHTVITVVFTPDN